MAGAAQPDRRNILERGYDPVRNTFVESYGGTEVDTSLLLIPLVGFLPIDDQRVQGTIKMLETELMDNSGFVLRYRTDAAGAPDGLPAGEGAFLACSFWLADTYVLAGRLSEATAPLERLLELANDLGLLAEEYDAPRGALTGNFPQALTHVSVVQTAQLITEGISPGRPVGRWLGGEVDYCRGSRTVQGGALEPAHRLSRRRCGT